MNRRVALVCFAAGELCGCSLLFSLDGLNPSPVGVSDAGMQDQDSMVSNPADVVGEPSPEADDGDDATLPPADATEEDATSSSVLEAALSDADADASASGPAETGTPEGSTEAGQADADAAPLVDKVPAGYAGTPFRPLTIPGTIYVADYDMGGPGVAYCINATATGAACVNGTLSDWCCGNMKNCDERTQPTLCPIYRQDNDNAGLSHMNTATPDAYAAAGPTWVASSQGPMLNGPAVIAGAPVPQDANATTEQDVYLSHTNGGEWLKYTVVVQEAGKYAIGGFMAVPPTTTIAFDFGGGIATPTTAVPTSPCAWAGCPSTFHSWESVPNLATVTFLTAGRYLFKFTIVNNAINPNYFTFTKM